jgi:hypothetical protein
LRRSFTNWYESTKNPLGETSTWIQDTKSKENNIKMDSENKKRETYGINTLKILIETYDKKFKKMTIY